MRTATFVLMLLLSGHAVADVRIRDVSVIQGGVDSQIFGYGLVVGLNGSGDSMRNSVFTEQSLQAMLDRFGVNVRNGAIRAKNVAAVLVTADISAAAKKSDKIDVTVSSVGDAASLAGGSLIRTSLSDVDRKILASAQGQVTVTGFNARGQAETLSQGVPTSGRIPNGAIIESANASLQPTIRQLTFNLRNPDYGTAIRAVDAINSYSKVRFGRSIATERDDRTMIITIPASISATRLAAEIGEIRVDAKIPARVVVDSRSGTIIIGEDVTVNPVAVTHGALSIRITEAPIVSQPQPLSRGQTVMVPQSTVEAEQTGGQISEVRGASLRSLVRSLNALGLKPPALISILQGIKAAGALQAELIIQ